jgi:hypothetical protein
MRETRNREFEGKHVVIEVRAKDLTEFDILSSGSIVLSVSTEDEDIEGARVYLTVRQQCTDGTAVVTDSFFYLNTWVAIITRFA